MNGSTPRRDTKRLYFIQSLLFTFSHVMGAIPVEILIVMSDPLPLYQLCVNFTKFPHSLLSSLGIISGCQTTLIYGWLSSSQSQHNFRIKSRWFKYSKKNLSNGSGQCFCVTLVPGTVMGNTTTGSKVKFKVVSQGREEQASAPSTRKVGFCVFIRV